MIQSNSSLRLENERYYILDVAKAILIFFVVWGHTIQYLHGTEFNYWESPIFKFIYGFHMPLFALISGYLMRYSIKKYGSRKLILKRAKQLLIPTVSWAIILTSFDVVLNFVTHESNNLFWILNRFISRTLHDLWFLKAMFISCIIVVLIEKVLKGKIYAYIFVILLTLFLPFKFNLAFYGFVLPFYIVGYKFGYIYVKLNERLIKRNKIIVFSIFLLAYIFMLFFFHKNNYIYTTGLSIISSEVGLFNQIIIDVYRCVVAVSGCGMLLSGCALFNVQRSTITNVSSKTMAIYIVTASIFTYVPILMNKLSIKTVLSYIPAVILDIALLIPLSLLLIVLSLLFERIIKKTRLSFFIFGT